MDEIPPKKWKQQQEQCFIESCPIQSLHISFSPTTQVIKDEPTREVYTQVIF